MVFEISVVLLGERMRQTEKVFSVEEDDSNNFDAKSINEEANYLDSILHYFQ